MLDNDGATACSLVSDEDVDQNMDLLDKMDRRILASVITGVCLTYVLLVLVVCFRLFPPFLWRQSASSIVC